MNAFSYAKSTSRGKTRHRRRHRYYIINRKRFICSQLILCILIVFMITMISNPTKKEVNGQEQKVSFNLTSVTKPESEPKPMSMHNLVSEYIVFASELETVRNTFETYASRGGIERNTERYEEDIPDETQTKSIVTSNTDSAISQEERHLLEQLVEAEAKGESLNGKIAIVNVVLNRVKSEDFPDTITEVIMQDGQFSPVANGSINNTPSEDSILAVKKAIDDGYKVFGPDILYFCNKKTATNQWIIKNREEVMTIGNHTFYY